MLRGAVPERVVPACRLTLAVLNTDGACPGQFIPVAAVARGVGRDPVPAD